tara:strand:- start:895 stop:1494 length:600 start_codon:yes stop_codon:yes gene_type:complete
MRGIYNFIIKPKGNRYNNIKNIDDKELILNTEIFNHQYVNREAIVLQTPIINKTQIKKGDNIIVHHNVFRRWHNVKGVEKNSRSWIKKNQYTVFQDQIFAYKRNKNWKSLEGYCFVKPIKSTDKFSVEKERPLIGIIKYTDNTIKDIKQNDLVGFTPHSEYEFIIDGERLYRVLTNSISIKYEYQGDEEEYNPSWAQGG